jgi:hypothetical protein
MSAQQGTIGMGRTAHLPVWPLVIGALGVVVGSIGLTMGLTRTGTERLIPVQTVTAEQVRANSSAAVREAGPFAETAPSLSFPGALETAGVAVPAVAPVFPSALETSGAAIREAGPYAAFPGALETAGVTGALSVPDVDPSWSAAVRARYEALGRLGSGGFEPIVIGDYVCHQCR